MDNPQPFALLFTVARVVVASLVARLIRSFVRSLVCVVV